MAKPKLTGYEKSSLDQYTRTDLIEISKNYTIGGKSTGLSSLTKSQLINTIRNDVDYIRANPENTTPRKIKKQIGSFLSRGRAKLQANRSNNRISPIVQSMTGFETPEDLMNDIIQALSDTESSMVRPGKYYTFIYYAKTPNIKYDVHPLVQITELTAFGFKAFNYHWPMVRQYTWPEVAGTIFYEVTINEYTLLQKIPYKKFLWSTK